MMAIVLSLVIFCNLVALAQAYTTFRTNCTAPSTSVNFVSSNETRGTIDILWSCLFTIIACTWTVQHLNVPEQREDRDKGWLGDIKWALKRTFRSAKWMLVTAIAPETLIMKGLGDWRAAYAEFESLSQLAAEDEVPWSITHSLFANMGGFVIRGNVPERVGKLEEVKNDPASSTLARSPEPASNGQEPDVRSQSGSGGTQEQPPSKGIGVSSVEIQLRTPSSNYSNPYHLLASDLVALKEAGFLVKLPFITKAELNDKNKSDSLVRFLAVVQILWMIIQIIVRGAQHLAISQLEIAVVAFAVCAIGIYGLNWEKPKGVQVPYTVLQYRRGIPQSVLETVGNGRRNGRPKEGEGTQLLPELFDVLASTATLGRHRGDLLPGSPIPNHSTAVIGEVNLTQSDREQMIGLLLGGLVFGGVHISAWDFVFPTLVERNLWRAASVGCTAIPLCLVLIIIFRAGTGYMGEESWGYFMSRDFLGLLFELLLVLYIAARLFLLVEIFRTLCFLPPSAYVATQVANIPHFA